MASRMTVRLASKRVQSFSSDGRRSPEGRVPARISFSRVPAMAALSRCMGGGWHGADRECTAEARKSGKTGISAGMGDFRIYPP